MLDQVKKGDLTGYIIARTPRNPRNDWEVILVAFPKKDPHPFVVWSRNPDGLTVDGGYHDTLYSALGDFESRPS